MHEAEAIERDVTLDDESVDVNASRMVAGFEAKQRRARDALLLAQLTQEKNYNAGRLLKEFEVGDLVVIN
jgi:ribosomal protein L21E